MPATTPMSRRERNKQEKLARIVDAAGELFAERGVDEVTTQEIARRADIGTGTLFLYARNKGELLLLVQNALYLQALESSRKAVRTVTDVPDAVLAVLRPIVECNRTQVDNGRTYLREMVFGDPTDPQHARALGMVAQTEQLVAEALVADPDIDGTRATTLARVVSSIAFMTMAAGVNEKATVDELLSQISAQLRAVLNR